MAAVMNGVALHGGFIPYGGTFLTFSDYSRNAIRMAALMKQRVIHVFTHDSIGLGEDGPTHQSVEHAASLRLIPEPRRLAPRRHRRDAGRPGPRRSAGATARRALLLSRQNLPYAPKPGSIRPARRRARRDRQGRLRAGRAGRGRPASSRPQAVIDRHRLARCSSRCTRSSCWPSRSTAASRCAWSRCPRRRCSTARTGPTRSRCCRAGVPRIAVEMGVTDGWWKYGCAAVVGIDRYGESAPGAGAVQALRVHGGERRGARFGRCSPRESLSSLEDLP